MGRASRWLGIFLHCGECTKDKRNNGGGGGGDERGKKRRSQAEVEASWLRNMYAESDREQSNHAIAVAAASAAAADAAVAAAQAAVAVVRLTSNGRGGMYPGDREWLAAVRIQSVFRGYLARKALRALKALVKLQALVRGYLVRKHAEVALRGVRTVVRAHSGGRRSRFAELLHRRSLERFDDGRSGQMALLSGRRTSASLDSSSSGHDRSPKIVEVDTFRPSLASPRIRHYSEEKCRCYFATAQSTPRRLGSAVTAPATPAKVVPEGFPRRLSCPNYMASTRSFVAKVRSQSVPRQRLELAMESVAAAARRRNEMVQTGTVGVRRSCSQIPEAVSFRNAVAKKLAESSGVLKW